MVCALIMLWPMQLHNLPGQSAPWPASWLVPDWPVPPHVSALCTSKDGGVSAGVYGSLNLGLHVGDDAAAVGTNRRALADLSGVHPVFLDQVHGVDLLLLERDTPDGMCADGAYTSQPGLACTVMVADCLPVLFCDAAGTTVAAAHAGWRGLLGIGGRGVLEVAVDTLRKSGPGLSDTSSTPLFAWLGPCIGPRKFEVGGEVREAFMQSQPQADLFFQPTGDGKWLADLQGLARSRLTALGGISVYGNDGGDDWCTVSQPLRFFSHRRDRVSGRLAACIWLRGS